MSDLDGGLRFVLAMAISCQALLSAVIQRTVDAANPPAACGNRCRMARQAQGETCYLWYIVYEWFVI